MRRGLRDRSGRSDNGLFANKQDDDHLSVSQLTRQIKATLEGSFGRVLVEGEIGNLTRARSGHLYISLKDDHAVIDVVMWRGSATRLSFTPEEGEKVLVRGELSVYEPRGRYQLVATSLQPLGRGELQIRFEALVAQLREEGLFDPAHKKPIPERPETVGVVTSATGAAVRDIIKVIRRRAPGIRIVVAPCVVQGAGAAEAIRKAIVSLDRWGKCDVMIVGRGGGSAEDLWAFNEEPVARAIFAATTPIVSAVGHEIDISIADYVADMRAATPSEAAEAVAPDMRETARQILGLQRALSNALYSHIRDAKTRLASLRRSTVLRRPMDLVHQRQQQWDETLSALHASMDDSIEMGKRRMEMAAARLEGLSPLSVLARGYSVTTTKTNEIIRSVQQVEKDRSIVTRVPDGCIRSIVTEIEAKEI